LLNVVSFDWRKHVDHIERIETAQSYRSSMEMSRRGLIVGPSSGLALAGLLQHLEGLKEKSVLDEVRDEKSGDIVCVFPCPDWPTPYLDEYFNYLDASDFPSIRNEEVLVNKP
jgi:cysteine synthase A